MATDTTVTVLTIPPDTMIYTTRAELGPVPDETGSQTGKEGPL
jgi:hypothetical protein